MASNLSVLLDEYYGTLIVHCNLHSFWVDASDCANEHEIDEVKDNVREWCPGCFVESLETGHSGTIKPDDKTNQQA